MKAKPKIRKLFDVILEGKQSLYIQTHDFPDHDAIAAAFGLQALLKAMKRESTTIFHGQIKRSALSLMIKMLGIDVGSASKTPMTSEDQIVMIDSCKGNKNITSLEGTVVAIIDHHQYPCKEPGIVCDIRPHYGSCSTIITEYFRLFDIPIPQNVASALLIGLSRDTDIFKRKVSRADVDAYIWLQKRADRAMVGSLLRNNIQLDDLSFYRHLLINVQVSKELGFCYFPSGCHPDLMGILGDFLLSVKEIQFSALFAKNEEGIRISLRNETGYLNAASVMEELLVEEEKASGGGHAEMAAGLMQRQKGFDPRKIFLKLQAIVEKRRPLLF